MIILHSKASVKTIKRSKHLPIFEENVEMLFTITGLEISSTSMHVHKQLLSLVNFIIFWKDMSKPKENSDCLLLLSHQYYILN